MSTAVTPGKWTPAIAVGRERAKKSKRDTCRRGWSRAVVARDQSAGQIMQLSAGDESSTVLPQAKKCCASAVARAAGFGLREQAKEGKRDT